MYIYVPIEKDRSASCLFAHLVGFAPKPSAAAGDGEVGVAGQRRAPALRRRGASRPVGLAVVGHLQLNELPVLRRGNQG